MNNRRKAGLNLGGLVLFAVFLLLSFNNRVNYLSLLIPIIIVVFLVGVLLRKARQNRADNEQQDYPSQPPRSPYGRNTSADSSRYRQPAAPYYAQNTAPKQVGYSQPAAPYYAPNTAPKQADYGQPAAPYYAPNTAPKQAGYGQPAAPYYAQNTAPEQAGYGQPAAPYYAPNTAPRPAAYNPDANLPQQKPARNSGDYTPALRPETTHNYRRYPEADPWDWPKEKDPWN